MKPASLPQTNDSNQARKKADERREQKVERGFLWGGFGRRSVEAGPNLPSPTEPEGLWVQIPAIVFMVMFAFD
jgi:hypothetical protein